MKIAQRRIDRYYKAKCPEGQQISGRYKITHVDVTNEDLSEAYVSKQISYRVKSNM